MSRAAKGLGSPAMDITTIIVVLLTVLLLGYLFATLLKPEKF